MRQFFDSPNESAGPAGRSPLRFFLLVYALASPFWLIGWVTGGELLPGLPVAALMAVCPAVAALLLIYQDNGLGGVAELAKRTFDFQRIRSAIWYVPILLLMPCVGALSFFVMRCGGIAVPVPTFSLPMTIMLFLFFFVGALCEELGWSGYVIEPLQNRLGGLLAALMLGFGWAVIHYIPLLEAHRSAGWIAWWSLGTVATRVIMVWLYNSAGRSVFAVTLLHTMSNMSWQLFPVHGSYFDPRINGLILALLAVMVSILGGSRTYLRRP